MLQAKGRLDEVDSDDSDNLDQYSYSNEIKTRKLRKLSMCYRSIVLLKKDVLPLITSCTVVDTSRYAKPGWKSLDVKPDVNCMDEFPSLGGRPAAAPAPTKNFSNVRPNRPQQQDRRWTPQAPSASYYETKAPSLGDAIKARDVRSWHEKERCDSFTASLLFRLS